MRTPRRLDRLHHALAGGVALCLLAACGSTVQVHGSAITNGGQAGLDQGSAGAGSSPGTLGGTSGTGSLTGAGATTGGPSNVASSAASTGAASGGGAAGVTTPHVGKATLAPVRLGFTIVPDAAAFASAFGMQSSTGDQATEVKAAVSWVNAHGGLNGHPIQPFIEEVSATSSETYDSQYQALCSKYTQDDHVVAATILPIITDPVLDTCMSHAKTLLITGSNWLHDPSDFRAAPYAVAPSEPTLSSVTRALTRMVLDRSIVTKGGRLGLISYDVPQYNHAIDTYLKPLLSQAGVALTQYTIPRPASYGDIGGSISSVESATLKMKAQGIKTVMFICPGCAAVFAIYAKSQNYYPRYVLSSLDPMVLASDKSVFGTAVGIGWEPIVDQDTWSRPKAFADNPTYNQCLAIEKKSGQVTNDSSLQAAVSLCEGVMDFYVAAKANPTATITADSLRAGLLSLGTRHASALNLATSLSPSYPAGAAAYRFVNYNDSVGTLAYTRDPMAFFEHLP